MSKEEKKELIEKIAEQFVGLEEKDKSFIVGYMTGIQEERQRWQQESKVAVTA